jgi:hypothetical protein
MGTLEVAILVVNDSHTSIHPLLGSSISSQRGCLNSTSHAIFKLLLPTVNARDGMGAACVFKATSPM